MLKNRVFYPLLVIAILIFGFALLKIARHTPSEVKKIYHTTVPDAKTTNSLNAETQAEPAHHTNTALMNTENSGSLTGSDKSFVNSLKEILNGYDKSWAEVMDPSLPVTHPFNVEARHKSALAIYMNSKTPEELENLQGYFEAVLSESYLDLLKGGASHDELSNFLADTLGDDKLRDPNHKEFRKVFPTGTHADYEPEMRARLNDLIRKNGSYSSEVLSEFLEDKRAYTWYHTRRLKYDNLRDIDQYVNVDWVRDVRGNVMPLTEGQPTSLDVEITKQDAPTPSKFATTDAMPLQQTSPEDYIKDMRNTPDNIADKPNTQSQLTKSPLPEPPPIPSVSQLLATDAEIEVSLREHFSPKRFNNAISTLDQYGPEEGLRRIMKSDPEVAKHIESLVQPKKEQTGEK